MNVIERRRLREDHSRFGNRVFRAGSREALIGHAVYFSADLQPCHTGTHRIDDAGEIGP